MDQDLLLSFEKLEREHWWFVVRRRIMLATVAAVARGQGCAVVEALFEDLPLSYASVNLLVALDVLEHRTDDHAAATEAYRILKPGGTETEISRLGSGGPIFLDTLSEWDILRELVPHQDFLCVSEEIR